MSQNKEISIEEYKKAKEVVEQYENNQHHNLKSVLPKVEKELKEYFIKNKECHIKKFFLRIEKDAFDDFCLEIHPTLPRFDEDYDESEETADEINEIGKKYGFSRCGVGSEYYGK